MTEAEELELLRLRKKKALAATVPRVTRKSGAMLQDDEDHIITTPEAEDQTPGRAAAFGAGAAQGASFGLVDEASGVVNAGLGKGKQALQALGLMEPDPTVSDAIDSPGASINGRMVAAPTHVAATKAEAPSVADLYRKQRDDVRAYDKSAQDAHPGYHFAGTVAGSFAAPLGAGGSAAKAAANVTRWQKLLAAGKMGAKLGVAFGAGNSEADLTKGEFSRFAGDVEESALLGAGTGLLGGAVSSRFRGNQAKAAQDAVTLQQKLADKAVKSARGSLGGEVSAGFRTLEQAERAMQDPSVDAAVKAEAQAFLQSDVAKALRNEVLRNATLRGTDQLSRIEAAKAEMLAAAESAKPDAVNKSADSFLNKSTLKEDVIPRVRKYAARALPQWISGLFGGGDAGKVAGTVVGAQMGDPGTALGNMVRNPRFRFKTNGAAGQLAEVGTFLGGAKVGPAVTRKGDEMLQGMDPRNARLMNSKYVKTLQDAADKGPAQLAAAHYVLSQRDPEYRALTEGDEQQQ